MNINPNLLFIGLVYLIGVWLFTHGIHRHARRHHHRPQRPATHIVLHIQPKE